MDQSVSKVTEQLSQKLDPQEVYSFVQSPRRTEGVAGHRLCVYLRQFEGLEPEVQVTKSGSLRDSRNESLCECTPQLFMMWMMVLETEPQAAENTNKLWIKRSYQNWPSSSSQDYLLS